MPLAKGKSDKVVKENIKDMKDDMKEIKKGQDRIAELIITVLKNKNVGLVKN